MMTNDDTLAGGAAAGDQTKTETQAPATASPDAPAKTDASAKPPAARSKRPPLPGAQSGPAVPEGHPLRAFFHALKDFLMALPPPEHNLGLARDELVKATHELLGIK